MNSSCLVMAVQSTVETCNLYSVCVLYVAVQCTCMCAQCICMCAQCSVCVHSVRVVNC